MLSIATLRVEDAICRKRTLKYARPVLTTTDLLRVLVKTFVGYGFFDAGTVVSLVYGDCRRMVENIITAPVRMGFRGAINAIISVLRFVEQAYEEPMSKHTLYMLSKLSSLSYTGVEICSHTALIYREKRYIDHRYPRGDSTDCPIKDIGNE